MGGEWAEQRKLSKFIVDWENGTRAACTRIELEMCINFAQVYLRTVTDKVKIKEKNNSI